MQLSGGKGLCPNGMQRLADLLQNTSPPLLSQLSLSGNGEGTTSLAPLLDKLYAMQALKLSNTRLDSASATALATALTSLTSLTSLDIRQNQLGIAGWAAVGDALERVTSLSSLNGCCQYTAIRTGGLREMALGGSELGMWVARFLERSAPTLTRLDVSYNALGPDGITALAASMGVLTALNDLYLWRNAMGSQGAAALCTAVNGLTGLAGLRELGIGGNSIDDAAEANLRAALKHHCFIRIYNF
uniref:Uncharacterized protein n=2 Tax=Cryptomonas curvata TaxID=233186 RepID=A0A7S0QMM4_9CRYP|mmetsp:Transcript_42489/g.88866  ORF Transcript_42489/g.88866 Transcript_42489/m.88866 type:complete len:245 (+) Transcript_42489:385-1119(+)